jgi:hypothetical protein
LRFKKAIIKAEKMIQQPQKAHDLYEKYQEHKEKLKEFLLNFVDPSIKQAEGTYGDNDRKKYVIKLVRDDL